MNLENLNLVELNAQEKRETGGGRYRTFVKAIEGILTAAGVYDAYRDFKAGWNSVR